MDPSSIHTAPTSDDELMESEEIFAKPTGVSRLPPPEPVVVQEKPAKQKRPLSEKQKAHLQRITKLAAEKRRAKAAEKVAETPQLPKQSPPETPIPKESLPPAPTPAPSKHQAPTKGDFDQWMQNFARFDALVQQREAQAEEQRAAKEAAEKEQQKAAEKTEPVAPEFGEYTRYFL